MFAEDVVHIPDEKTTNKGDDSYFVPFVSVCPSELAKQG